MKWRVFAFLMFFSVAAYAQNPVITATITGADGCIYANGTYNLIMVDSTGRDLTPGSVIFIGGTPQYVRNIQGTLDGFGRMSVAVTANNSLTSPTGTQWKININSQNPVGNGGTIPPQRAFNYTTTINANVNLTTALSAIAPPLNCATGGGGGSPPHAPAFSVQAANAGVTAPTSDPNILINTSTHTLTTTNLTGTGTINGATVLGGSIEGAFQADQQQSGGGNNGIANSLTLCGSLLYPCNIAAQNLYGTTEAQAYGGINAASLGEWAAGPKSTDPAGQFCDYRTGTMQCIFNGSTLVDNRHPNWPTLAMKWIGNSSMNGTFADLAGGLNIENDVMTGTRNFFSDKTNVQSAFIQVNKFADAQTGGFVTFQNNNFGNGDAASFANYIHCYGGPETQGDEGCELTRAFNTEPGDTFQATLSTVSVGADGTTSITTSSPLDPISTSQGEGRLLMDMQSPYNTGYISAFTSSGGDELVSCAGGCNWDSTFGTSTQTTLTAAVTNPGSTNSFPQSSVTISVGSSSGFSSPNIACIYDYDFECEKITGTGSGTITLATVRKPHPVGSYVTTGGLAGYAIEFEADRTTTTNASLMGGAVSQTIRYAIPIMLNTSGNHLKIFQGYNQLPGHGSGYTGRAYATMAGSGGSCTPTVAGGILTAISVSGGTSYQTPQVGPPQITFTGTWTTQPSAYITASSGSVSAAAILNPGSGIGAGLTCSIVTSNAYDIYPAAKTVSVYNTSTGTVDGSFVTQPFPATITAGDAMEQPHYFLQHTEGDGVIGVGSFIPSISSGAHSFHNYNLYGAWQGSDVYENVQSNTDATMYSGYPSPVNVAGRGQWITPIKTNIAGPWRQLTSLYEPPFAPAFSYNPSVMDVGCGALSCSAWTTPYYLMSFKGVIGTGGNIPENGWTAVPSTDTMASTAVNLDLSSSNISLGYPSITSQAGFASQLGQNWNPNSNLLTAASWTTTGSATVTLDASLADPFGGTQAVWKVVASAANSGPYDTTTTNFTVGQPVSGSIWVYMTSSAVLCTSIANSGLCFANIPLNKWTRLVVNNVLPSPSLLGRGTLIYDPNGAATWWVYNPVAEENKTLSISGLVNTTSTSITTDTPINQIAGSNICTAANGFCTGGGAVNFSLIGTGTNTTATMTVGTGGSIALSGTGTVSATSLSTLTGMPAQAANTVLLNATGSSAAPTAVSMPTGGTNGCSGATEAIQYNTSTHLFGCNTTTGGITTLTGDVAAGPGTGSQAATIQANAVTTSKINNTAVTLAKIQNAASNAILLGSGASGSGSSYSEITLGTNLSMSGTTLNSTGAGGFAGTETFTSNHTLGSADNGFLIIFNCSSACALTLPNPQPSSTFLVSVVSIGSSTATITLGASMTWYGGSSVPVLVKYTLLPVASDSGTSTNYVGQNPLVAGTNITLTPGANGLTIAATIGGGARKGTFICTGGGTISIANTNELATSDVVISMNAQGGTITTPPAMKTVTAGTGFSVLCGATDTSTYNYNILN